MMRNLSDNWISEGLVDFEYKKYLLLAYLKEVETEFRSVKLYPPLAELIKHHQKLEHLDKNRSQLKSAFPRKIHSVNLKKAAFNYKDKMQEDEVTRQLGEIIAYSLPKIKKQIQEGKNIYNFIEDQLEIEPVGLSALYQKEGYALVSRGLSNDVWVYRYKIDLFQNSGDKYRGIALSFIAVFKRSLTNTYHRIKLDLIRSFTDLPNPSTWRIHSKNDLPLKESLLPVSKRLLLKNIDIN